MFNNTSISKKYPIVISIIGLCIIAVTMFSVHMILEKRLNDFKREMTGSEAASQDKKFDVMSQKITSLMGLNLFHHLYHHDIKEINLFIKLVKSEIPITSIRIADAGGRVLTDGTKDNSSYGSRVDTSGLKSSQSLVTKTEHGRKVVFSIGSKGTVVGYGEVVFPDYLQKEAMRQRDNLLDRLLSRFEGTLENAGLILTLAVITITVLLSIFLSRKISVPLITITDATKSIAAGDLSVVVPVPSKDEMGALAEHFNAMVERLNISNAEMKFTENMLRESETMCRTLYQEFHVLLDAIPDTLLLLQPDLKIVWANKAAEYWSGKSAGELMGWHCYESWFNRSAPCENCYAIKSIDTATVVDSRITDAAGRIVDTRAFPIKDDDGTIKKVLVIGRDITEKIRIEETAKRTSHLAQIGLLSAGMAHEINNPNNFILSNAQMLQDIWYDADKIMHKYYEENGDFPMGGLPFSEMSGNVSKILHRITEGSLRIGNIVASLKSYAAHDGNGQYEEININRVINYALLIVGHQIKKFTDNFMVDLSENLPPVRGDSRALEQTIINIAMNALQALPARNCGVRISTHHDHENNHVVVRVRDEGIGMSGDILERIFDPFFTTKHDKGGTGLGLSISLSIVKKSNGSLEYESEPGKGTTAVMKLPCVAYSIEDREEQTK